MALMIGILTDKKSLLKLDAMDTMSIDVNYRTNFLGVECF